MAKTIVQKVLFKNTTPQVLYNLYMNAKKHTDATGVPAKISDKEGAKYSAHDGYITGKNPFHDKPHDQYLMMDILNGERPQITDDA